MAQIEALGGWDKLMETLQQRLEEQKGRHEGGSKWIGTGGTSPFGHGGYNPEGIRIGGPGGQRKAVKVWERREYRNLDDSVELGTRNIKVALRKLRRFAREGAADQFDIDGTISATARNAGLLDLKFQPERHNALKLLLFFDVGGSMESHVRVCEELFSAARGEFKHLEYFYFHNFIYESVWKDSRRRHGERTHAVRDPAQVPARLPRDLRRRREHESLRDHAAGRQHRALERGGGRGLAAAAHAALPAATPGSTPSPRTAGTTSQSIGIARQLLAERMYPLTLRGLDDAIKALKA